MMSPNIIAMGKFRDLAFDEGYDAGKDSYEGKICIPCRWKSKLMQQYWNDGFTTAVEVLKEEEFNES